MPTDRENTNPQEDAPKGLIARARRGISWLNANKKRFFWWWIAYQAIKGMTTLSLIWIPLLLIWLRSRGEG